MTYKIQSLYKDTDIINADGSLTPKYKEVFYEVELSQHPYLWQIKTDKKTTRRFEKKGIDGSVINDAAEWLLKKLKEDGKQI